MHHAMKALLNTRPWLSLTTSALIACTSLQAAPLDTPTTLAQLLTEATRQNPEILAARARATAAQARIAPAGALEDPMAEFGVVNAPLAPFSLRREDMTMQMIGLSQRLPFAGKRALRRDVARGDAESSQALAADGRDQIVRQLRLDYEELAATQAELEVVESMRATLGEFVSIAQTRYAVGSASQTDVLQGQSQIVRARQQELELERRRTELQASLAQMSARGRTGGAIIATSQALLAPPPPLEELHAGSPARPRAAALDAQSTRARSQIALARREFLPDVDVKLSYGRRQRAPDGMPRDDMVSLTFGVNLPIWRRERLDPQLAEARAMLAESESMARALTLETDAEIAKRHAAAFQARQSVQLFETQLLPTAQAAVDAAVATYRVGRVDFLTLLEARMRLFEAQMSRIAAVSEHNRAVADLDYLAGRLPAGVEIER